MDLAWVLLLAMILTGCVFVMASVTGYVFFVLLRRQRRHVFGADEGIVKARSGGPLLLRDSLPEPESHAKNCPVCGGELSSETPEGLCPQCLMQCVLSHSDHGL